MFICTDIDISGCGINHSYTEINYFGKDEQRWLAKHVLVITNW